MGGKFFEVLKAKSRLAYPNSARKKNFAKSHLEVRMFNVGDGEAILLVFPKKRAWLVDCGASTGDNRNKILGTRLAEYLKQRKLVLEALVPSHPHKDHAGAFVALLQAKPKLAKKVRYWRSDDPSWKKRNSWIPNLNKELGRLGSKVEGVALKNAHRDVSIAEGVSVHLFAGSSDGAYTSLFVHLRYHDARLLFTGDAHCTYEKMLLDAFGEEDFRAQVLKVTHHGSSSGTARTVVKAVNHGIAIASTAQDEGHRLEKDTLKRIGGHGRPRRVFETLVDGDIIMRTDGSKYGDGVLYELEFESPGRFAAELGARVIPLTEVNKARTSANHSKCK